MTKMFDPDDYAARGPQVTARHGSKRRLQQLRARAVFFAVLAAGDRAERRRLEARIDQLTTEFLEKNPPAGNA